MVEIYRNNLHLTDIFSPSPDKTDYRNIMGDGSSKNKKMPYSMSMVKPVQFVDNIEDNADRVGDAARQKPQETHIRQCRFETANI